MTPPPITALIIDDEPLGRDLVRHMLGAHPDFHLVGECGDGEKALAAIKRHAPRVVFLDIRMPRLDGLTLLERLDPAARPLIVFITAHDAYALQAFAAHVFDYLLKPFDQDRFDQTIARVRTRLAELDAAALGHTIRHLISNTLTPPARAAAAVPTKPPLERIVVRESARVYFVDVRDIEWLEASGNYVALHVAGGKPHLVHETLSTLETQLDPAAFVRLHRSTIVRIDRIRELQPHFNGEYVVFLKDGTRLKLSRTYLDPARAALGLN